MKITDCIWEKTNLGVSTIEITLDEGDTTQQLAATDYERYGYVVAKVPVGMSHLHRYLAQQDFVFVECQYRLSKEISPELLSYDKVAAVAERLNFVPVTNQVQLDGIKRQVLQGMFSTDRISLDPRFGIETAARRYANWLQNDFDARRSRIEEVWLKGQHVGFMMVKVQGEVLHNVLNGLYLPYQRCGLGIVTAAAPLLYGMNYPSTIWCEETSISSNNMPVVRLYNYLDFRIDGLWYVFVKHRTQH
jgi:acetyltransferase, GNAT family